MSKKLAKAIEEVVALEMAIEENEEMDTEEMESRRANRLVVNPNENGWTAEFFKTHFSIGTIDSRYTTWAPKDGLTITGQREDFRQWAIDNSYIAGATWNPADLREDWNVRVPKYTNDQLVVDDINKMINDLVLPNLVEYIVRLGLVYDRADMESIVPTYRTSKGNDIKYVTDGKYDTNGNWAWGTISTTLVFLHDGAEIYVTRNFELVSGCLKKMRITKPEFETEVKDQLSKVEVLEA